MADEVRVLPMKVWLLVAAEPDRFDIYDVFASREAAEGRRARLIDAGEERSRVLDVMEFDVREDVDHVDD